MKIVETNLTDAYIITNDVYVDERGSFTETFNWNKFKTQIKDCAPFVQDNHSISKKGVLRGLHYQIRHPQGKLVRCISGEVFDVIVDLRQSSKTFGKWFGVKLNRPNLQLWVPAGFAHGFYTLSDTAEITYKVDDYYYPQYDRTLLWDSLNIVWGNDIPPTLSAKDLIGKSFEDCEKYE